jgi:multiple sugar transport system substrate-binding protein
MPAATPKLSRREFLRATVLSGLTLGVAQPLLAACAPAVPAQPTAPAKAPAAEEKPTPVAELVSLRFVTNHGEADQPFFKKVIENFEKANPNIKIEHLDIAGAEFYDTINAQGVGGNLPDVWYTRTFDIPVYANKGWTVNLQPLIERDAEEVNVDDFWPAEVEQMKWKGDLYALPYDFSNIGIYYNKNMFDEAGIAYPPQEWKWPELVELGLKFVEKDASGNFTRWGLQLYTWNWVWLGLIFGWGGKVFTEGFAECVIDSPETRALMEFFISARKKGLYPEAGTTPQGVDPFAAGLVPMSFQGSWATTYMRNLIGDKFDFDCVAMPLSPDGKSCISAAGGAWGIAINTKHLEEAWTWNKHLTSTESTNILISEPVRSIPGRKSSVPAWEKAATEGGLPPRNAIVFAKQMEIAYAEPFPPFWQDYAQAWSNMIDPLLNGTVTEDVGMVLAAFQQEVNRIIELSKGA